MRSPMFDDVTYFEPVHPSVLPWEVTPRWLQWLGYKPLRRRCTDLREMTWEYKEPAELLIE